MYDDHVTTPDTSKDATGEPMTIAIDKKSGAVVGQLVSATARRTITHNAENDSYVAYVRLLTARGYVSVPADSVRLEEVS